VNTVQRKVGCRVTENALTCANDLTYLPIMIEVKVPFPTDSPSAKPAAAPAATAAAPAAVEQTEEAWKAVTGYPAYEATTDGQVRRASNARPLKSSSPKGQPFVKLTGQDGKQKTVYVKTAVLLAHQPAYPPGTEIRHLNGDGMDSTLLNLAWMDDELRLWGTAVDGTAIYVQAEPYGRRRAWGTCAVGHQISTTGKPDRNTAIWGTGNRHCLACLRGDPKPDNGWHRRAGRPRTIPRRWQNAPQPHYNYTRSWGVATAPTASTARGRNAA
jgi:hypothetical protein